MSKFYTFHQSQKQFQKRVLSPESEPEAPAAGHSVWVEDDVAAVVSLQHQHLLDSDRMGVVVAVGVAVVGGDLLGGAPSGPDAGVGSDVASEADLEGGAPLAGEEVAGLAARPTSRAPPPSPSSSARRRRYTACWTPPRDLEKS